MIDLEDIKAIVTPKSLAKMFLGSPSYERGNALWYCSPFRDEKHPSFKVDDIGMYDFGTNTPYGIFDFVMALKHCSFGESRDLLASLYGIADREYDSRELAKWYKAQREEKIRYEKELHAIYLAIWDEVDAELRETCENIEWLKGRKEYIDAYKILLDRQVSAWGMNEYLAEDICTLEDKEELKRKAVKGELPAWLMNRLKAHTTILQTTLTKRNLRREY